MSDTTSYGEHLTAWMKPVGISKSELAERAGIDRGTLDRVLSNDPKVSARTRAKIDRARKVIDDELGDIETGEMVTTTVEFGGTKVTVKGSPAEVAETVRRLLR